MSRSKRSKRPPIEWWGGFDVPVDHGAHWQIGPFSLAANRRPGEWRLATSSSGEIQDERVGHTVGPLSSLAELSGRIVRFAVRGEATAVLLSPATADRSVVARPEVPFHLLPGEQVALFVSTPAWVRLLLPDPPRLLLDLPTVRPSDSWFGSSTRHGELCYSSRTSARLEVANLPPLPHRVITKVQLSNSADDVMTLERLNLPVPSLSLFSDRDGWLWTESVSVERERGTSLAAMRLGSRPPNEAIDAELLEGPREPSDKGVLVRAFSALFG